MSKKFPEALKAFGQHFLVNEGIIHKIGQSVDLLAKSKDIQTVLEIGPGPGVLTEELLNRGYQVHALEIDPRMIAFLQEKFAAEILAKKLHLHFGDALEVSLDFIQEHPKWIICGNLPYNVGTHILFRFLEEVPTALGFVYMLQKEVVQRLMSPPNSRDYGIPSVKLALTVDMKDHFWVQPGSFAPPPKVQSGVLSFVRKSDGVFLDPCQRNGDYDRLATLLKKAFSSRRKMLKAVLPNLKDRPEGTLRPENIEPHVFLEMLRAEVMT